MTARVQHGNLSIAAALHEFIAAQAAPGVGVTPETFWNALAVLLDELADENRALLERRDALQAAIDEYARSNPNPAPAEARRFLEEIGYLAPEGPDFVVAPANVDPEIARIAGPQLVVPVTIPRYVLNAAGARWGSLYDALYGSDAIPDGTGLERTGPYNPARGRKVMDFCADFLDVSAPLAAGSHKQAVAYLVEDDSKGGKRLAVKLSDGSTTGLADPAQFVGYLAGDGPEPASALLRRHGLHVELRIDRAHPIGATHPAGLKDVVLESAVTTILDMEDSVAVVDAEDKVLAYSVLLGLARGDLTATFEKGGRTVTRGMAADREFLAPDSRPDGRTLTLPGRSLLLVRNVGLHMTTGAVLRQGREIPEGLLDALVTGLIGLRDVGSRAGEPGTRRNSRAGSIYVVKPKLHGPEEVAFACKTFARVEELLGLPPGCMKIGVMDEERRTTLNLKECVRAARDRIIFINTGFLDRTGDEIHTCMEFGPVLRKNDMRAAPWMLAYEDWNVDVGLACGMAGRGQIGKGMWAKPDRMAEMLAAKSGHPLAGANCAWVPSPTAATLHATHYHAVDVAARQAELAGKRRASLDDLLTLPLLPLLGAARPSAAEIQEELDLNAQSILGYVVRWVEQGVGCSKIPDLSGVGLMEDRATLRISSQHVANWLRHGLCGREQVEAAFRRMAAMVDAQNVQDPAYRPMSPDFETSMAFRAALELVFTGCSQPSGYTEAVLHAWRLAFKAAKR